MKKTKSDDSTLQVFSLEGFIDVTPLHSVRRRTVSLPTHLAKLRASALCHNTHYICSHLHQTEQCGIFVASKD